MKVLIGGGSGFVGHHLIKTLERKGHEVVTVSRMAGAGKITWKDLHMQGLPKDCNAVVNLSGQNLMDPLKRWNEQLQKDLRSSRIDTTLQMVGAITQADTKPKVWVSASAVGFYPPDPTAEYTESSESHGSDFLSRLCVDWEAAARLPSDCTVRHVTVRIGLVLGRDGGMIQNLYMPFFLGVGGRIASGKQWFPWIHADDVAGIFTHAIEGDDVTGVLNAVAPVQSTNADFTRSFARAMWRPALFPVPEFVLTRVYGAERAKAMVEGQKVLPQRTVESGYKYLYPDLDSACLECAKWK